MEAIIAKTSDTGLNAGFKKRIKQASAKRSQTNG